MTKAEAIKLINVYEWHVFTRYVDYDTIYLEHIRNLPLYPPQGMLGEDLIAYIEKITDLEWELLQR